ncbi:hypothetical protein [Calidifontibacter indicus]|uniref:hypothetical protein n=1 Tax=Calidifontibacter indicus TaxID=419650 RepID=UPI003D713CC9
MGLSKFWKAAGDTPPADWAEQILRERDAAIVALDVAIELEWNGRDTSGTLAPAQAREWEALKMANALHTAVIEGSSQMRV